MPCLAAALPHAVDAAGASMQKGHGRGRAVRMEELHLLAPSLCATAADVACQQGDVRVCGGISEPCLLDLAVV